MIEVVAIGDELLKGMTVDRNAAFLGRSLLELGYSVSRHSTFPDNPEQLLSGLQEIFHRAKLVIVTGGLGPTCDDHTREIIATLFNSKLSYREEVARDLKRRFGENLPHLVDQATIPDKATPILNRLGTAPGLILQDAERIWIFLPGVPQEMEAMFAHDVVALLKKGGLSQPLQHSVVLNISLLNENAVDPLLRELAQRYPEVTIGIYPNYGYLKLSFACANEIAIRNCVQEVQTHFSGYLYESNDGSIEAAVHEWFTREKKTLALAESCTGGRIAATLTRLPGASQYFLGSLVTYSNAMKQQCLGVSEELLVRYGAVSQEVVTAMWEGVLRQTQVDFAVAVSGIAGPDGGSEAKPVGTMWAAIGAKGKAPDVGVFCLPGQRETRILWTTHLLLGALYRKVQRGIPAFS